MCVCGAQVRPRGLKEWGGVPALPTPYKQQQQQHLLTSLFQPCRLCPDILTSIHQVGVWSRGAGGGRHLGAPPFSSTPYTQHEHPQGSTRTLGPASQILSPSPPPSSPHFSPSRWTYHGGEEGAQRLQPWGKGGGVPIVDGRVMEGCRLRGVAGSWLCSLPAGTPSSEFLLQQTPLTSFSGSGRWVEGRDGAPLAGGGGTAPSSRQGVLSGPSPAPNTGGRLSEPPHSADLGVQG